MSSTQINKVLVQLQDPQHLERTKALEKLKALTKDGLAESVRRELENGVVEIILQEQKEAKLGGFSAAVILIPFANHPSEFLNNLVSFCRDNLEHSESRVRQSVGDCLEALAIRVGVEVYISVEDTLMSSIYQNLHRDEESLEAKGVGGNPMESLLEASYRVVQPGTGEMRHGTEGWKSLETSYGDLLKLFRGTGPCIFPCVTQKIWELIFMGFEHPNRFVREIAYSTVGTLFEVAPVEVNLDDSFLMEVARKLAKGLADDWSQVRHSASVATRIFMLKEDRSELYPLILPQMCLNRYYVAEGVKLYSQETWKLVVGQQGRELVAQLAAHFVDYYIRQCGANNHAVREAACSCIAELMVKIAKASVEPFVPRLIQALINCFKDASWPVRDAACVACGKCVLSFPEQAKSSVEELYTLWMAHLADNISSVREDSAVALGDAIRAYGQDALDVILPQLRTMISEAKNQQSDSVAFSGLRNVTQFGVANAKVNEDAKHTDQTMFSCGSLAPKLARGGGCMDHGFKRPKQPWEVSDGAVYLLRELSILHPEKSVEFLPPLTELMYLSEFEHACYLHDTVWKVLPTISQNIGKRNFKIHLSEMLDALFRSLRSDLQLEVASATEVIKFCSGFLGRSIFRGRLSEQQAQTFDSIVLH